MSWLSELRRRWFLALVAVCIVALPVGAYAITAVPSYTAKGAVQVSSKDSAANPLLEMAGAGGRSEVETEVEIMRRRQFVLAVFKGLGLHLVDPHQADKVTTDLNVAVRGASPLSSGLRRARAAVQTLEVGPDQFGRVPLQVRAVDESTLELEIGEDHRTHTVAVGERVDDEALSVAFAELPVDPGESLVFEVLSDGALADALMPFLRVSSMGTARQATNLVEVTFTHPDRRTAQSVVQATMDRYLDQSLHWQTLSASNASDFIEQRLEEASGQLRKQEETLRKFSEAERAVQLDTQAKVTIESVADLESEKMQVELQERVIGDVLGGVKKRIRGGKAHLTANFFDDPVLAASVQTLTEAETQHAVLSATLTEDHPKVRELGSQIALMQKEVARLLRSSRQNLSARRKELDKKLEQAMGSLSEYPDKELQLARYMRDVEVSQRLYGFLLEKYQEAEILKASTTIDKRVVDAASMPHRKTAPRRGKLVLTGLLGGLMFAFAVVYLTHLLKRKLETVESVREAVPYAVYGTMPAVEAAKDGERTRISPAAIWKDTHGPSAEAFRALSVSVSLSPAAPGRGRIVQVTSSQPGEGKSTVISNLAVGLAKSGAKVLLLDLDLRKPVQHRGWGIQRNPGYSDLIAQGAGPGEARGMIQTVEEYGVDVLSAGTKLPDTLGALMSPTLESMLASWSKRYDYVLIDSPPAFVADTTVVGQHADLILVVARPGAVERGSLRQAVEGLGRLEGAKGLILNGVTRKHAEYYYYGSGYYYAQSYGEPSGDSGDGDRQAS